MADKAFRIFRNKANNQLHIALRRTDFPDLLKHKHPKFLRVKDADIDFEYEDD